MLRDRRSSRAVGVSGVFPMVDKMITSSKAAARRTCATRTCATRQPSTTVVLVQETMRCPSHVDGATMITAQLRSVLTSVACHTPSIRTRCNSRMNELLSFLTILTLVMKSPSFLFPISHTLPALLTEPAWPSPIMRMDFNKCGDSKKKKSLPRNLCGGAISEGLTGRYQVDTADMELRSCYPEASVSDIFDASLFISLSVSSQSMIKDLSQMFLSSCSRPIPPSPSTQFRRCPCAFLVTPCHSYHGKIVILRLASTFSSVCVEARTGAFNIRAEQRLEQ
jgi:hypothetical protein